MCLYDSLTLSFCREKICTDRVGNLVKYLVYLSLSCRYGTFNVIGLAPSLTIQHLASKRYHEKRKREVSSVLACACVDLLLEQFICHCQFGR